MKNLKFLITAFILITSLTGGKAGAQSLSFSQVLMITSVEDTVPPGKVWKVESFMQDEMGATNGTSTSCNIGYVNPFLINGVRFFDVNGIGSGSGGYIVSPKNQLPLWLPAGTRLAAYCSGDFLSVIEFTVTP